MYQGDLNPLFPIRLRLHGYPRLAFLSLAEPCLASQHRHFPHPAPQDTTSRQPALLGLSSGPPIMPVEFGSRGTPKRRVDRLQVASPKGRETEMQMQHGMDMDMDIEHGIGPGLTEIAWWGRKGKSCPCTIVLPLLSPHPYPVPVFLLSFITQLD